MGYRENALAILRRHLPSHLMVDSGAKSGAVVFSDASASQFLAVEPGMAAAEMYLSFSDTHAEFSKDGWSHGARAYLGPFLKASQLDELETWVSHYSVHWAAIDLDDPFLHRFRDARDPSKEEVDRAKKTLRGRFSAKVCSLRGDTQRSLFSSELGTFHTIQHDALVSSIGFIPPFASLGFDFGQRSPDQDWADLKIRLDPEVPLSWNQASALATSLLQDVATRIVSGESCQFESEGRRVTLTAAGDNFLVEPNLTYVLELNSGRAQYKKLLGDLGADWRAAYDRIEEAEDPEARLLEEASRDPSNMTGWRSLAKYYESRGMTAEANVALARGYAAKGSKGIALSKVRLALAANPQDEAALQLEKELGGQD